MRVPNPWMVLRDHHPDVLLLRLPIGERGRYYHDRQAIVVRTGLRIVEERTTLWHELQHVRKGDTKPCDEALAARQELICMREAAREAIPLAPLCHVARWTDQLGEAADELKVTSELLAVRIKWLHPAERGALQRARRKAGPE